MPEIDEFENVKSEVVSFVSKKLFDTAVDRYISKSLNVVHNKAIRGYTRETSESTPFND